MVIERVSRSDPPANRDAQLKSAIVRFALIESIGVVALAVFLLGFFSLDWFPGQPTPLLVGALVALALYMLFAMWISGLLAMFTDRTNAGR